MPKRSRTVAFGGSRSAKKRVKRRRVVPGLRLGRLAQRRANVRVSGMMGLEVKYADFAYAEAAVTAPTDSTGGEHNVNEGGLNVVAQGTGVSQRDGRKATFRNTLIKGYVAYPPSTAQATAARSFDVTIWVVLDKMHNASATGAQSEEIFEVPLASVGVANLQFRTLATTKRFQILAKKTLHFPAPTITGVSGSIVTSGDRKQFEMFINYKGGLVTQFQDTDAQIDSVIDNLVQVYAFCSSVTTVPVLSYVARSRFVG